MDELYIIYYTVVVILSDPMYPLKSTNVPLGHMYPRLGTPVIDTCISLWGKNTAESDGKLFINFRSITVFGNADNLLRLFVFHHYGTIYMCVCVCVFRILLMVRKNDPFVQLGPRARLMKLLRTLIAGSTGIKFL